MKGTAVGWAESLGQVLGEQGDEYYQMRNKGTRPFRQSKAHDLKSGLIGSRKGGANGRYADRKLDSVLGKPDEEG